MQSFGQARLSQSICILGWVFWMPVRAKYILEKARNCERRVNLEQSRRQYLRLLGTPSKCAACSSDTKSSVSNRQLSQCLFCPCQSFIIPTCKEVSMRHPFLHPMRERIDRAYAHSMCEALDGSIRFAEPHFDKTAASPPHGQVRINQQCLFKEGSAIIEFHANIGERISGETECGSVVLTQLHSPSSQPSSFRNIFLWIYDPAKSLAHAKTPRGCGIRRREIGIKFNSSVIRAERFLIRYSRAFVIIGQSAQVTVVGIEAFGWFASSTFDFCLFEPRRDCPDHFCSHLVLQLEDVLDRPFEAIRPKMGARYGIDKLP